MTMTVSTGTSVSGMQEERGGGTAAQTGDTWRRSRAHQSVGGPLQARVLGEFRLDVRIHREAAAVAGEHDRVDRT